MKIRIPKFFRAFQFVLAGYATFGRSFAYIGYPPLFIGEVMLAFGLLRTRISRGLVRLAVLPTAQILLLFFAACAVRALFDFPTYGLYTLRDSAIWYYGLFAILMGTILLEEPNRLVYTIEQFRRFAPIYAVVASVAWVISFRFLPDIPLIPGTDVPILSIKGGDVVVHLTAVVAFFYLGFGRLSIPTLVCSFLGLLIIGASGRAALVVPILSFSFIFLLRPRLSFVLVSLGLLMVAAWIFSFVEFNPGDVFLRQIDFSQIGENLSSIFGFSGNLDLDGTRQWRLDWWHRIFQYTFHGDYFWTGKGFGINLAEDDGIIDIGADLGEPLRSPHNSHLTFLARGGVPLFFFWIVLQLSWAVSMLRTIFRARARGDAFWEKIAIFVLTYWVAMMVNMSFDVYLEGPMGGIWFWTVWGYGLAIMWLYRYRPQCLAQAAPGVPAPALAPQAAE